MADTKGTVHSVDKAFYLLDIMSANKEPMSLKALSAMTGFPKPTIHALLATMRERGIIEQNDHGAYELGYRLFEYGLSAYSSWDDIQLANPIMSRVVIETRSNCILAAVSSGHCINVGYWAASEAITGIFPFVGTRNPLHATAQGKVFLAYSDEKKIRRLIEKNGLKKYTPNTITDPDAFLTELRTIREKGFAICDGELHQNNKVVSVPVFSKEREVIYALGVLDDIQKIKDENVKEIVRVLKREAKKLSKVLDL